MESRFLPNLQQPRTSTENQKVAPGIEATFCFSVEVRSLSSNKDSSYDLLEAFVAQLVEVLT